jgi:hypothetical protein
MWASVAFTISPMQSQEGAMPVSKCLIVLAVAIVFPFAAFSRAAAPKLDPVAKALEKTADKQQMLKLPVVVVDSAGNPVTKAKVTPWALRSSQGHGWWSDDDKRAGAGPKEVVTDENGEAEVLYPKFRDVEEQIRTIAVSLFVDHPKYAYVSALHIDVPLQNEGPYEIKLNDGVMLEVRPLIDGKPADLSTIRALWSDGRSWRPGSAPEQTPEGTLRIPALSPGKNSVLLVKLDGDRATHFSKITDVELKQNEPVSIDVALSPAVSIKGVLSDNVPRPVRRGRVKIETLPPSQGDYQRVGWHTWTPVQPDGTFTIERWPANERLQLVALSDGFHAASGNPPDVVEGYNRQTDGFTRPQVFDPVQDGQIEVVMTPLVRCVATAVDEAEKPIPGVKVVSWPNVGWWNGGSQIYCESLVRGENLLKERDYFKAVDKTFAEPFQATTDAKGKAILELPAGGEGLAVQDELYELPAFLGRRDVKIKLVAGETTETMLRLQPRGNEKLGEWDKLAGVVFGCSTREGRQICALPGVRKKMDEFVKRFREAKDQRDPQLLSEAYAAVSDAFKDAGDADEAAKWRKKADEQAAKVKNTN